MFIKSVSEFPNCVNKYECFQNKMQSSKVSIQKVYQCEFDTLRRFEGDCFVCCKYRPWAVFIEYYTYAMLNVSMFAFENKNELWVLVKWKRLYDYMTGWTAHAAYVAKVFSPALMKEVDKNVPNIVKKRDEHFSWEELIPLNQQKH